MFRWQMGRGGKTRHLPDFVLADFVLAPAANTKGNARARTFFSPAQTPTFFFGARGQHKRQYPHLFFFNFFLIPGRFQVGGRFRELKFQNVGVKSGNAQNRDPFS
jgi:hypothetical protein